MLCDVCKDSLEGMWDPSRSTRLALLKDFMDDKGDVEMEDIYNGWHLLGESAYKKRRPGQEFSDYVYGHHKDRASFLASKQEGCAQCSRLHPPPLALIGDDPSTLQSPGYFSVFYLMLYKSGPFENLPIMKFEMRNSRGDFQHVGGDEFCPLDTIQDNLNFDFGPSNHDSKAWSIMDTWMSTCLNSHPQCNRSNTSTSYKPTRLLKKILKQKSYRPTRLLKIENPSTFRLVLGTECPSTLQYVALSHCWGTKPVESLLRLLQSTIKDLMQAQPVQNLPKTFREAIEVSQHFGVHYIWIDRLCIFQDSAEDWQKEASTMQDVYRNALFSICALGAQDGDAGCFFDRDPTKVGPTIVSFKMREEDEEKPFRLCLEKGRSWHYSFNNEPLVQRSWIVQERLLAPRTLHFGSKQLFWECREAICAEMHPEGVNQFRLNEEGRDIGPLPLSNDPFLWKQLLDAPDRRLLDPGEREPYERLFYDWNAMASYYASRALTVSGDKLIALSGLANDMKAKLQQLRPGPHRYLAGLWEEKLAESLVWNVTGPARRALHYRTPSWSWACLDGDLELHGSGGLPGRKQIAFASIVSVDMMYSGKEDTGKVDGGILTLEGPCALAEIDLEKKSHNFVGSERDVLSIQGDDGTVSGLDKKNKPKVQVVFDTLDDVTEKVLLIWVWVEQFREEEWYGRALALTHVEEERYRRVGMAERYFNVNGKADAQAIQLSARFPQKQITII